MDWSKGSMDHPSKWHANVKPTTKLPQHCKKSNQFLKGRRPYEGQVKPWKFIHNVIVTPIGEN